ncbi:MAG TPA: CBS domain-containing protein [Chloroflexota bacterium]|jgi:CBS domain-containing protein/rubredoxin|nr:CBS domain-containing protein [Chloroflexota bacterium]
MQSGASAASASEADDAFFSSEHIQSLLERLRREPALRAWVLTAPTGALATLGVVLDDNELVLLLERIEELDERAIPVTALDIMTPDPITFQPEMSVHDAAAALAEHRISGAPVVSKEGSIAGIVSEYDLIARTGATVRDVMTRDVVSVKDTSPLDGVRALLVMQRLKRVPVVNSENRLVGLISRADLVRELAYRWQCKRCGNLVRARRPPSGCPRCGAASSFQPAPPLPAVAACPTCGKPLDK